MEPGIFWLGIIAGILVIAVCIAIGIWSKRLTQNLSDYYVAGRTLPAPSQIFYRYGFFERTLLQQKHTSDGYCNHVGGKYSLFDSQHYRYWHCF